jgi:DNA-binding GntR family transcriptional regulator
MKNTSDQFSLENYEKPEPIWSSVLRFLREAIIKGEIKPGDKLKESVIAAKLGISRAPVREALRILEVENFVDSFPQRGCFVKKLNHQEIDELFFVLNSLNSSATKYLSKNMETMHRQTMERVLLDLKAIRATNDMKKVIEVTNNFHDLIIYATNNSLLIKIYESFSLNRLKPIMLTSSMEKQDLAAIVEEPISIAEAILKSDVHKALKLMNQHMDNACKRVKKAALKNKGK